MHHLIVGGQRSGKSRHAEALAQRWLIQPAVDGRTREVVVVATALAWDDEMRARIARHQAERPAGMRTVEEPRALTYVLQREAAPHRLLLVDCLTLWLTNWLMPAEGAVEGPSDVAAWHTEREALFAALPQLSGPVVAVSNEVGWGVVPLGREVRQFVDELGWLNQGFAARCSDLTLMVAGQAWHRPVVA
jgi:adenosylcobinamide kinase/adenosylcobinamide-phosphate guanylyltransferase